MHSPCVECLNRYGRKYSEKCEVICDYAYTVKTLKEKLKKTEELCAKAYYIIGQIVDKPNPFETQDV